MIQMSLEFELEMAEIPLEYERVFVSFLKAACSGYSEDMFNELSGSNKPIIKPYTFSVCLPGAEFDDEIIRLKNNHIKMSFSSCDMGHTIEWFNAFQLMKFKKYPMNRNSMKLVSIRTHNCRQVTEQEIVIKMQSSLVVRKHDIEKNTDEYLTYNNPHFSDVLRENIEFFLKKMEYDISTEGFSIIPIKARKIVATCFGRRIDANIGIYKLTGSTELLNLLYLSGIGARRSEGHGKFEIMM